MGQVVTRPSVAAITERVKNDGMGPRIELTEHAFERVRQQAYAAGYRDGWQRRQVAEQQEAYVGGGQAQAQAEAEQQARTKNKRNNERTEEAVAR